MDMLVFLILLLHRTCQSLAFLPEIQMPYKAVSWDSVQIGTIDYTLTCNEERTSTRDCAIDCYKRELNGSGCPGFYRESLNVGGECYICHPSSLAEIRSSLHTSFNSSLTLYLLELKSSVPEISVNFDNYTDTIVNGKGTIGTKSGVVDSDHVEGIKDKALYLHNGGRVSLTGLEGECWTNMDNCTSGVTMSIWFKPPQNQSFLPCIHWRDITTWFVICTFSQWAFIIVGNLPEYRYDCISVTQLTTNQWYFLTGTIHPAQDTQMLLNGHLEKELTPFAQKNKAANQRDWGAMLGIRDSNPQEYPINGQIDEFKYFYRVLSTTEIWREFIGYNIDLDPTPLILPPYSAGDPLDYSVILDGNNQTCIDITAHGSCDFKMKLLNTARDTDNFSVVIHTAGLSCHDEDLYIYGHQDIEGTEGRNPQLGNLHFVGTFSKFEVVEAEMMNGFNRCIFKPVVSGFSPYVFVSVKQIPESETWRICELEFA